MDNNFGPDEIARLRALLLRSDLPSQTIPVSSVSSQSPAAPSSSQSQIAPPASGIQSHPAPITQLYQPSGRRLQSLGNPQPAAGPSSNLMPPFLGFNLPTANANQARMASASATLPRPASLPRRGRRGPAQNPPSLPSTMARKASAELCFGFDISGNSILRILIKVMPPPPVSTIILPIISTCSLNNYSDW
jgi:hypothetical protein